MIKVRVMNEYQIDALLTSDIEINYDNFYKDDLVSMLKVCRDRYRKKDRETTNLKQALNEIKEIIQHSKGMGFQKEKDILQIIDKVGDEK